MGTIRILLALAIVLQHTPAWVPIRLPASLCVQMFFAISGFYMCFILSKKRSYQNPFKFWFNRFLRLYPSYVFIIALTLVVSLVYMWAGKAENYPYILFNNYIKYFEELNFSQIIVILISQITMLFQDLFVFLGIDLVNNSFFLIQDVHDSALNLWEFLLIPQGWSISLEISFYALCPLLIKLETKWLYFLILSSLAARGVLGYYGFSYDPFTYRCFPLEITNFLLGFIAYKELYLNLNNTRDKLKYNTKKILIFNFIPISLISYFIGIETSIYLILVVCFACSIPLFFEKTKNMHFDRKLGNLSYPVYINHCIVIPISIAALRFLGVNEEKFLLIPVVIISIALALMMVKYIEQPIEKLRQQISTGRT